MRVAVTRSAGQRLGIGAAALAVVLAGCTRSGSGHVSDTASKGPAAGSQRAAQSGPCKQDDQDRASLLALQMTAALQQRSEPKFLALATSSSARSAMSAWYANVSAIGFTTAAVAQLNANPQIDPDSGAPATQRLTVGIGLHNAFDETQQPVISSEKAMPDAPSTGYKLETDVVHDKGGSCHLSITSWTSDSHAPWDTSKRLVVVKTPHVIVAGDPSAAGDLRKVAPLAEKAATFLYGFYKSVKRSEDIRLKGFVMFVPSTDAEANSWFSYDKRPDGWLKDVGNADGVEYPLDGVQLPVSKPAGAPTVDTDVNQIGGGRVIITRTGLAMSANDITATLVHEFTHDLYNNYSDGWFSGKPTDAALNEGAARYVETFYRLDPSNKGAPHSMSLLGPVIKTRFSSFHGQTPTSGQIYGALSTSAYYYDLSASSFSYLASKYGITFAIQSIRDAFANGGGPFSGIVTKIHGGDIQFGVESTYEKAWAKWLHSQV